MRPVAAARNASVVKHWAGPPTPARPGGSGAGGPSPTVEAKPAPSAASAIARSRAASSAGPPGPWKVLTCRPKRSDPGPAGCCRPVVQLGRYQLDGPGGVHRREALAVERRPEVRPHPQLGGQDPVRDPSSPGPVAGPARRRRRVEGHCEARHPRRGGQLAARSRRSASKPRVSTTVVSRRCRRATSDPSSSRKGRGGPLVVLAPPTNSRSRSEDTTWWARSSPRPRRLAGRGRAHQHHQARARQAERRAGRGGGAIAGSS